MKRAIIILLIAVVFLSVLSAQTILVKGNVSTATGVVKYALITFTDENDTTKSYSTLTDSLGNYSIGLITDINDNASSIPTAFELAQNYPNPFSSSTAITYKLNQQTDVQVTIYDILGREVKKYNIGEQPVGVHGILWDGRNNFGEKVMTGIYFYRLKTDKESLVNKMLLTRGAGISSNLNLSGNFIPSVKLSKETTTKSFGESYKVNVVNTDSTKPRIAVKEIENVLIEKDTTVNISVNKLPIARAGEDSKVKVGEYVTLDGSKSELGDGSKLYYRWKADTTNPVEVRMLDVFEQTPAGFTHEGVYKFSLVVNDKIAYSEPDEVIVEVGARGESRFEDTVLELELRYRLGERTGELTDEKLDSAKNLGSTSMFGVVTSLAGIENCRNLTELLLGLNSITDLTPLSGMTQLEKLALDQNYILSDISPLANLTNLTELNIHSNNISDISALNNLIKIKMLNLIGNPIQDMSPLRNKRFIFWAMES